MKIPLIGIPRHLWRGVVGLSSESPGLILWRVFLILSLTFVTWVGFALTGGSAFLGIIAAFFITTLLSYTIRDDILAVWRDLWNARWGEVEV